MHVTLAVHQVLGIKFSQLKRVWKRQDQILLVVVHSCMDPFHRYLLNTCIPDMVVMSRKQRRTKPKYLCTRYTKILRGIWLSIIDLTWGHIVLIFVFGWVTRMNTCAHIKLPVFCLSYFLVGAWSSIVKHTKFKDFQKAEGLWFL